MKQATLEAALILCSGLYRIFDGRYFVGITGGLVYKDGPRKDIDILIYRCRQHDKFEVSALLEELERFGMTDLRHFGFVTKAKWCGYDVDIMHPESDSTNGINSTTPEDELTDLPVEKLLTWLS